MTELKNIHVLLNKIKLPSQDLNYLNQVKQFAMEPFKRFPQLGRFTLRDEGRTVAVGKVLKIIE